MHLFPFIGYGVLILFGLLFFFISHLVAGKYTVKRVSDFVLAGKSVPFGYLAASILVSWTWTTSIIGAAEAGMWYGVSGGLSYSLGAALPFFVFIPLVLRLKIVMPSAMTYTEFIGERFGKLAKDVYFVFAVLVVLYVFIEQAVGIGIVFTSTFGIPFKLTTFAVVMIVTAYITRAGIRGAIFNDLLHFFLICTLFGIVVLTLLKSLNLHFVYKGLLNASTDPNNQNYNPSLLFLTSTAGLRYGITAIVVAMGQVLLDQGYYSKALSAANKKTMLWSFLVGAVFAWAPISIICAGIFGHTALALKLNAGHGIYIANDITTYILNRFGGPTLCILFAVMIFSIGVSTGGNCLVGIQALFTADFYRSKLKPDATEAEQIRFGRTITVCIGLLCGFITIALEGISLLKIDIFSGIFFAAPCGALIAGFYSRKVNETIAILSIFLGLASGIGAWALIDDPNLNWFYGSILSLLVPIIIILLSSFFIRGRFNFAKLTVYDSGSDIEA